MSDPLVILPRQYADAIEGCGARHGLLHVRSDPVEGVYVIDSKNSHSRFHLALHISYPNAADRERARKLGVSPGGDVEIHGLESKYAWVGSLHRQTNWTAGCIAVTNPEIDEIWPLVPVGTPVEIRP